MTVRELAEKIPAEYREEILEVDMISKAVAITTDANMHYLATIWTNYIAPEDLTCNLCMERILRNYRELLLDLIELEKQHRLLRDI